MRFRFTIRDLLWLTLVVALCAAWWIEGRTIREKALRYEILQWDYGYKVGWRDRAVREGMSSGEEPMLDPLTGHVIGEAFNK
jgi:hypothetical protein